MQKRAEVPFEKVETALKEKLDAAKKGDDQIRGICFVSIYLMLNFVQCQTTCSLMSTCKIK